MNNGSASHKVWATSARRFASLHGRCCGLLTVALTLLLTGCGQDQPAEKSAAVVASPAPAYQGTIVAVGDSLTAGLGVDEDQAYPAQLARRLRADGRNYQVVNAGVSGETSSGALSRIDWVVASLKPDIVILETGANDGLRGLDPGLLQTNLDQLVARLTDEGIQVILAGMLMLPNLGPAYTRAFEEIYPRIAAKHDVLFVPFFLEGVAGQAEFNQADKLHPTAEGYTRIVDTLYPTVIEAIRRHGSVAEPDA
ncbi:MAG TPA: arylesterase [Desulfosarcina sp.]|nr:arylesterase [Desulfosarcina sp.]